MGVAGRHRAGEMGGQRTIAHRMSRVEFRVLMILTGLRMDGAIFRYGARFSFHLQRE
jgi:hypothetical protein